MKVYEQDWEHKPIEKKQKRLTLIQADKLMVFMVFWSQNNRKTEFPSVSAFNGVGQYSADLQSSKPVLSCSVKCFTWWFGTYAWIISTEVQRTRSRSVLNLHSNSWCNVSMSQLAASYDSLLNHIPTGSNKTNQQKHKTSKEARKPSRLYEASQQPGRCG